MMNRDLFGEIKSLNNVIKKRLFSLKDNKDNLHPKPLQGAIINYLYENKKEEIFQKDLENKFNISKAAISDVLNTMEKKEMIERIQSDKDARCKRIILTKKASKLHGLFLNDLNSVNEEIESSLTEDEIIQFTNIINKIKDKFGKDEDDV